MLRVGIKYCGGCNPEYDRVAMVEQIKERLAGKASFVPSESEGIDILLAVQGCRTACADLSCIKGPKIQTITNMEDGEKFVRQMIERGTHINAKNEK